MKRILLALCSTLTAISLVACSGNNTNISATSLPAVTSLSRTVTIEKQGSKPPEKPAEELLIQLTTEQGNTIRFELNDSNASKSLYEQLPLSLETENFSDNEKIFYPTEKLDTRNTPPAKGPAGTLAYYAPWGNVAVYYGNCGGASGLYQLGQAVSGEEYIPSISGVIEIEAVDSISESETAIAEENSMQSIEIKAGSKTFSAALEKNDAANSFMQLLKKAPLVIKMRDYAGFEKVGSLEKSLPESNRHMTAQPGDIVLYNGSQIVAFYGSNSWSYTKLAKIDDLSGWKEALGSGSVTLTFTPAKEK